MIKKLGLLLSFSLLLCIPAKSQQIALACPAGTNPIPSMNTTDSQGRIFENFCVGSNGILIFNGGSGPGGTPGGNNTDIQFNDSGIFGGTDNATLDSNGQIQLSVSSDTFVPLTLVNLSAPAGSNLFFTANDDGGSGISSSVGVVTASAINFNSDGSLEFISNEAAGNVTLSSAGDLIVNVSSAIPSFAPANLEVFSDDGGVLPSSDLTSASFASTTSASNGTAQAGNFLAQDQGTANTRELNSISVNSDHFSGTLDDLIGIEVGNFTEPASGIVTEAFGVLIDNPTYNGTTSFSSGLEVEDQCLAFPNQPTSCDGIHIQSQSSPGKALVVDFGESDFGDHVGQTATARFAGTCSMSTSTTCTWSLNRAFNSTPICITTEQFSGVSVLGSACLVSGTTVTITATTANSQSWGAIVIGNPN